MSDLIQEFTADVADERGRVYTARVRGDADSRGMWQGWLEFLPRDGGAALQTERETTQSQLEHLRYWASGLSPDYLASALLRAHPTDSSSPPAPPAREEPTLDTIRIHTPTGLAVVQIQLETLDPHAPQRVMLRPELRIGQVRRVPGGGIVVYDGVQAEDGKPSLHSFLIQYDSDHAATVLANHIWSAAQGGMGPPFSWPAGRWA